MKTQCPHCFDVFTVPAEYIAKQVKCVRCKRLFSAQPFTPPPIVQPKQLANKGSDLVSKLWKNTPKPFKIGFLSTLGVLSAAFFAFYIYGHLFIRPLSLSPLAHIQSLLSKQNLFSTSSLPRRNILRGRYLSEYRFFPDANRDWPYLSIWIDDIDSFVGLSASWLSLRHGAPTYVRDIDDENGARWHSRSKCVYNGFISLLGSDLSTVPYSVEPYKEQGSFLCQKHFRDWTIDITFTPSLHQGSNPHFTLCELESARTGKSIDPNVYQILITAIQW